MKDQHIQSLLAIALLVVVSAAVFALFVQDTPPSNKELISLILGVLLGALKDSFGYFFGSTRAVDRKDDMVVAALQASPPVPPPPPTITTSGSAE